jgi:hypothetical protein
MSISRGLVDPNCVLNCDTGKGNRLIFLYSFTNARKHSCFRRAKNLRIFKHVKDTLDILGLAMRIRKDVLFFRIMDRNDKK